MDILTDWLDADWTTLDAQLPWVRSMRGVRQDAVHHAEGDVWIHTEMVLSALRGIEAFGALPRPEQAMVHAACLLHDVAKAWTTRVEVGDDGRERVTARGHSAAGAIEARRILWELGVDVPVREAICALIHRHQLPFFCVEDAKPERRAILTSLTTRCDHLAVVNEADGLGRICADPGRLADNVQLFTLLCEELGVGDKPYGFASDRARLRYVMRPESNRWDEPPEHYRCEMVMMCGLPGSGKDTWIQKNLPDWPVVSLDRIRRANGIPPEAPQGPVAAMAKEEARKHLRAKRNFVWNATNLTRSLRSLVSGLALNYDARVRMVHVEAPYKAHARRNRDREHPVPAVVIQRMLRKWDVPDVTEAHEVVWVS